MHMHRLSDSHYREKDNECLIILITYLQNLSHCNKYLQDIFTEFDERSRNRLNIEQFERLLSVLLNEACKHSGYDIAPNSANLAVSYILNILMQLKHDMPDSCSTLEFTNDFVINLLNHLLSLRSREQKRTSTPKTKTSCTSTASSNLQYTNSKHLANTKLKKYKKISSKLVNSNTEHNTSDERQNHDLLTSAHTEEGRQSESDSNRLRINRRKMNSKARRSQSDIISDCIGNEKDRATSRSRSKSADLGHHAPHEFDHIVLAPSPTNNNSLVMAENPLLKYQKYHHHANGNKMPHSSVSRLFPPRDTTYTHTHHQYPHLLSAPTKTQHAHPPHLNGHGNGNKSPSDSLTQTVDSQQAQPPSIREKSVRSKSSKKQSKSHRENAKRSRSKTTIASNRSSVRSTRTNKSSIRSSRSVVSIHHHHDMPSLSMSTTERGVKFSRRRTENNLLSISRKDSAEGTNHANQTAQHQIPTQTPPEHDNDRQILDNEVQDELKEHTIEHKHKENGGLILGLIEEIHSLQQEQKESQQIYTNRISELEQQLKSERSAMQQTLRLYEQRIAHLELVINGERTAQHTHREPPPPPPPLPHHHHIERSHSNGYVPVYPHSNGHHHMWYAAGNMYHALPPQQMPVIDRYYQRTQNGTTTTNRHIQNNNVSVVCGGSSASSSKSSSHSHSSSSASAKSKKSRSSQRSTKSNHKIVVTRHDDAAVILVEQHDTSKKYRPSEKHRRSIAQQRSKQEIFALNRQSRTNSNLIRKKKSACNKVFEPIQLQENMDLALHDAIGADNEDDDDVDIIFDDDDDAEALPINPNAVSLPMVIDHSEVRPQRTRMRKSGSHQSNISNLSTIHHAQPHAQQPHNDSTSDNDTSDEEEEDDDEDIIVMDDCDQQVIVNSNTKESSHREIKSHIDDGDEEEEERQEEANILDALQQASGKQEGGMIKPNGHVQTNRNHIGEASSSSTNPTSATSSNSTSSGSNASSLLESESEDNCFYLFKDDEAVSDAEGEMNHPLHDDENSKSKYSVKVPSIHIPRSEKELFKKVKPAYKYHLQMIDEDGSITQQIEQRRKRREREKQMKQLYSRQNRNYHVQSRHQQHYNDNKPHHSTSNLIAHNSNHTQFQRKRSLNTEPAQQHNEESNALNTKLTRDYIKMCYFDCKPLGFQINESPDSILVTNVYTDRGCAFEKGIEKGWKIIEVNKENGIKGMMLQLKSSDGPFSITFDTLGGNLKNYHKMI